MPANYLLSITFHNTQALNNRTYFTEKYFKTKKLRIFTRKSLKKKKNLVYLQDNY